MHRNVFPTRRRHSRQERKAATLALILKAGRPLKILEIARFQDLVRSRYIEEILDELEDEGMIERTYLIRGEKMIVIAYQTPKKVKVYKFDFPIVCW
jgi:hypothetical protein